ncbi:ABC transporter ATP-binding protein [Rhodospirillum rubrum]|nr:ABC transporter ATP-binding protein [Rhodospirillum rubrum]
MSSSPPTMTQPEPALRLRAITKRFGALLANDAISLDLAKGEILALLGENGAGKTTLMNILFGHYLADSGSIEVFGKPLTAASPRAAIAAGLGMVHQHFTLAENLSVLENVLIGTEPLWLPRLGRAKARARLLALGRRFGLEVNPDAAVAALSVGERQRVEILKALYRDARILILDEPTAVLTPQESEALFSTLRTMVGDGLSVIFISHKLNEVAAVSSRVAVLRGGKLVAERPTAGMNRAALAELMVGRPVADPVRRPLPPGPPALALRAITVNGPGIRAPLRDVSLTVHRHEIVGIAGVSGNGQATLAALISGLVAPTSGQFRLFGQEPARHRPTQMITLGVGRIPEDRHAEGLVGDLAIWENLIAEQYRDKAFQRAGFVKRKAARAHARALIADFDVRCSSPDATTRLLSGGNMQKLILGRTLTRDPGLILANQPNRGLDIGAVAFVHDRLLRAREKGAAIVLISEDLDEILALSDRIAVIHAGRLSPPVARESVTIGQLGVMMAGDGPQEAGHAA